MVRYTPLSVTTGEELPRPPSAAFHFTPLEVDHFTGRFFSGEIPLPASPRNPAQVAARREETIASKVTTRKAIRQVFMDTLTMSKPSAWRNRYLRN